MKPAKQKKCKHCGDLFQPFNSMQQTCIKIECCVTYGRKLKKKEARKALKEYKDINKSYNQLIKSAWNPCSKFIRLRDIDLPCISCGRYDHEINDVFVGGKWDAGHYLSKAAHPGLRFHPLNIHKQCKSCNGGAGKYAKKNHTVTQSYRINLIDKIGLPMVEWLEGHHESQNWTHEDLREIEQYYKEQYKLLSATPQH